MNVTYNTLKNNIVHALDQVSTSFQIQLGNDIFYIIYNYTYSNIYNYLLYRGRKNGTIYMNIPAKIIVQTSSICNFINNNSQYLSETVTELNELELCLRNNSSHWNQSSVTFKCKGCVKSIVFNITDIKWDGGIVFTVEPFITSTTEILNFTIP